MEIWFDGRSVAIDYTVPNTLNLKQRNPGVNYEPYEVRDAAQKLKINKYADLAKNKNHEFVPLVAESLGGLGGAAFKLFGEIARSQASSRHPVGHILRRLIDISQIAVQKGNFRRLQKAVSLCSLDVPFNRLPGPPHGDECGRELIIIIIRRRTCLEGRACASTLIPVPPPRLRAPDMRNRRATSFQRAPSARRVTHAVQPAGTEFRSRICYESPYGGAPVTR